MLGGVGFEYQFFCKRHRIGFPTNRLISCSLKIVLLKAEDEESESVFSSKTVSFSFLENSPSSTGRSTLLNFYS